MGQTFNSSLAAVTPSIRTRRATPPSPAFHRKNLSRAKMVTISRATASVVLAMFLALGALLGFAMNSNLRTVAGSPTLRGDSYRRKLMEAAEVTSEANAKKTKPADQWEELGIVWPSKKAAGPLDGWGPEQHELAEMRQFWPQDFDGLAEVDFSYSYSYDF